MKSRSIWNCAAMAVAIACLWLSGCGNSSGANVVTVTVSSSVGSAIILGQSTTLTATVNGATNTMVNWEACQFTTTTVSGTTTTTSTAANCPSDGSLGAISNQLATGTATYTAPSKVPDQTKFPGLQIIITAQSQQDTKKTGNIMLVLDSGIGVTLTPSTATVPTNEPQLFTAILTNDLQAQGVVWLVTQSAPTSTITVPNLATCSPSCGSISASGVYTAPASVPTATTPAGASTTPANVTIVATAKTDNTRFTTGTITIIQGGPIAFNGISPTIAPQGATVWDIYLDAPNISSASTIILTDQNGGVKKFTSTTSSSGSTNQVKVLFPIPTTTTASPASIGARLRLLEGDLVPPSAGATPVTYTVSVTDPGEPVTKTAGGKFTFTSLPVRPTVLSASPNSLIENVSTSNVPLSIDGGYFGPGGTLASAFFQGNPIAQSPSSNSRRLNLNFPTSAVGPPGLYPLSVSSASAAPPVPNNPAVTSLAVFPDYSTTPPQVVASVPAGTNPSAIDIDPTLGVVVVAETGSNAVQFYTVSVGALTPLGGPVAVGQTPTGVSVNRTNHSVAVVNYGSQSVSLLPIPGAPNPVTPATIDLSNVLQGQVSPAPLPYAIGVDPDTNLALVAYSSTSSSSAANLGFVVNLNQGAGAPFGCLGATGTPPCIYSQVTLNTAAYPQIAMAPHGHLAFVTPGAFLGGGGAVRGVDVTLPSTSIAISSLSLSSGVVTATAASTLTGLIPGIPSTVLISGVPTTNSAGNTNFNGVFTIAVTSSTTFSYLLTASTTASGSVSGGTIFFGSPDLIFGGLSPTTQGIAINPITNTAALADASSTSAQIDLLNQLDQSFSAITFSATCTAYTVGCVGGPELEGTATLAWQPYTNSIISYNPGIPGRPVNQVSISDAQTRTRRAFACVTGPCTTNSINTSQIQLPGTGSVQISVTNGTTGSLTLWGGVAVDPATNQAFVVESGSGGIQVIALGPAAPAPDALKPAEITEVVVPSPTPGPGVIGGIPKASVPQGTLTSTTDLAGVQIFGAGFVAGAQVRLDGTAIPAGNVVVDPSGRKITATIPASFLSAPHHYALDVISGSPATQSNPTDFLVIKAVNMNVSCTSGSATPSSVAIADQLANGPFSPIAVVTNSGCNSVSTIDINPTITVGGVVQPNPTFGNILHTIAVGTTPQGVAVSQHLGLAVVANNGSGNVSIVNLLTNTQPVAAVTVGTNPVGVAINDATGAAIVANFGSNTVSEINLGLLFGSAPATSLTASTIGGVQQPIAVAIDPDRGTNNQGLALVTGLELVSGSAPVGALFPVDIGLVSPSLSTTISLGSVSSTPTGIVFNPAVSTGTQNPGLFYVNSSGANVISSFNPDSGSPSQASVGINPTALAVNPQTGAILTSNFGGKTASIVDSLSNPMKTRQTLGLPGSAQFGVAIDQFTNLAVIVDQANNRVLLFPMPN